MPLSTKWLAGVQWFFFLFSNTIVIPLSIGMAFDLSMSEIAASLNRSFIYTGIACILQALIGHRYPLLEGQSGLWWGVILSLVASAPAAGMSYEAMGGSIALGIAISGVLTSFLGGIGLGDMIRKLFKPMVMSVYVMLLSFHLMIYFFRGMVGLAEGSTVNPAVAALSIAVAIIVGLLHVRGRGLISNFSILIGMLTGWLAYELFIPRELAPVITPAPLLGVFPWGTPQVAFGIILTTCVAGIINMSNTIASIHQMGELQKSTPTNGQFKRAFVLTGINAVVSGFIGLVPYAPYVSTIGFLRSTRILQRSPFIIGSGLFFLLGLVPSLSSFFSRLPISIGSAVLFAAYLQLFGTALSTFEGVSFSPKTIYRVAAPVLFGLCIMNVPAESFELIPFLVRPLLSNGLLMGVILSVVLENCVNWSRYAAAVSE